MSQGCERNPCSGHSGNCQIKKSKSITKSKDKFELGNKAKPKPEDYPRK